MEFDTISLTQEFPSQNLVKVDVQDVVTKVTFMSDIGRDILIDFDIEKVSFHLNKEWKSF